MMLLRNLSCSSRERSSLRVGAARNAYQALLTVLSIAGRSYIHVFLLAASRAFSLCRGWVRILSEHGRGLIHPHLRAKSGTRIEETRSIKLCDLFAGHQYARDRGAKLDNILRHTSDFLTAHSILCTLHIGLMARRCRYLGPSKRKQPRQSRSSRCGERLPRD